MERKIKLHPCTYPKKFIPIFANILKDRNTKKALDIFGGIGGLAKVKEYGYTGQVIINEIEPKWAKEAEKVADKVICGDARKLRLLSHSVDAIVTSPTYGNDMAVTSPSREQTYTVCNQKPLQEGNTGKVTWGDTYKELHKDAYKEAYRVLTKNGIIVINIKNHIRKGKVQNVAKWHRDTLQDIGFKLINIKRVKCSGVSIGGLNLPRVSYEHIMVLEKGIDKTILNKV